jgi:hypothetical protein
VIRDVKIDIIYQGSFLNEIRGMSLFVEIQKAQSKAYVPTKLPIFIS